MWIFFLALLKSKIHNDLKNLDIPFRNVEDNVKFVWLIQKILKFFVIIGCKLIKAKKNFEKLYYYILVYT